MLSTCVTGVGSPAGSPEPICIPVLSALKKEGGVPDSPPACTAHFSRLMEQEVPLMTADLQPCKRELEGHVPGSAWLLERGFSCTTLKMEFDVARASFSVI